ncbi:hypothetical protein P4641_03610 [Halalkalibacterium halodurans]|uniref:hypothetical protein n=1 Tax=Halalkalibacterium halodurans TaxID=86665 RepID=UPI002E1A953D|nr:hypothetical protein [Halalkalibacterium halodurans]
MALKSTEEFLELHESYKKQRGSIPTKEEFLIEIVKIYYDSTTKRDKKSSAKLVARNKERLKEYGFWKFIDEEELNRRLN